MLIRLTKKTYRYVNGRENLRQPVTYLFIGGASALSDIILLFILVHFLHIFYLLAATISFLIVSTFGFFLHKNLTFRHKGPNSKLRYFVFIATAGSGLIWSLLLLFAFVDIFKIWYLQAAIMVKFIVLAWNFMVNKFFTFKEGGFFG